MKRGYGETSHGQIHYLSEGTGDVVLLLHQALRSGACFSNMLPLIGQHYRAIAIDLPGRGNSDPLPAPFEVSDLAASVIEFLDSIGVEKFRVVGGHTGSAMSVELAATHPERVEGLVLLGFPFVQTDEEREAMVKLVDAGINKEPGPGIVGFPIADAEASGAHLIRLWHWLAVRLWQGKRTAPEEAITEEDAGFITEFLIDILRSHKEAGRHTIRAVFRYPSKDRLPLVKAPMLLVQSSGVEERSVTQMGEMVTTLAPRAKVVNLKHADSYATYFIPQELCAAIVSFFQNPGI